MNCPHCGKPISPELAAKALGSIKSEAKTASSRENAKLGGWPKGRKRRPSAPEPCNKLMFKVGMGPGGIYCDLPKDHEGFCSHTEVMVLP
jgi:hypothetical protein